VAAVELNGREPKRWRFEVLALVVESLSHDTVFGAPSCPPIRSGAFHFYITKLDFERAVPTMAAIRPKITFVFAGDPYLLCISPVELAATERKKAVYSLAIELLIWWASKRTCY
jgi:hypothetical protein